jgi:hypothetical protein
MLDRVMSLEERGSTAAPPRFLDPVMSLIERLDRTRRRIRPMRPGGVLGIELRRWRGSAVTLDDGAVVRRGDLIGALHFDNARLRELTASGSLLEAWQRGRGDLRELGAWAAAQPPERRPVAYFGEGLHGTVAARVGFEVRPRPRTWWTGLQDWYFRGLLARWSRLGRGRLRVGTGELHASEYWLSADRLQRLHGPPDPRPAPAGGSSSTPHRSGR